ncbi:IgGFc-binding protein [Grus japonensis]|uniref:IgGFc-binding protein n=1 Tax=Grus japonensis TaxID=30415 RepID=A0ABC9XA16_GRUJA
MGFKIKQRPIGGLRTWDPETAYLTRCDFNNNSRPFCDWTQPCNANQGVWIRTKHDTPTDGTGPDGDYPDGKGYFIYQEASNLIPFDTNRLESPETVVSEKICIDFWYYMFGSEDMNELRVLIQDNTEESIIWSRKGNQSSLWTYGAITHTFPSQRKIKVIFEAVRGLTEYGDTALDNVRVRDGSCVTEGISTPVPPTPTPTEPTPPPVTEAICSIHGDPHYNTFDKQRHDFMGTCTYTLSKLCESNSSLPYFNVEAANEHRGSNTRVSYVQYVDIDVYGYRINLGKNRIVKVDGVSQVVPLILAQGISISFSGQYVVVTTDFGLNVKFDGNHRAEITLPSTYMSKVCGICGNYNGHKADDFLNPDGEMESNSASLGNSWQVYNDSRCLPDDCHTPNCTADEKHMIQSNEYCGLITDPNGPFQNCHSVVDPQSYSEACQYDLCELHLNNEALCQNLQAYADVCQAAGVQLTPWRNATFCPLACPANSHYEPCAAACPATCVDPLAPYNCSLPCVEGCVCDSGYLLYNDRCVPSQQCGCWHNGQHYPVGSEFWTDNTCSSKCTCPARGSKVQCSSASCPAGQYCGVQDGKPECLEQSYGICHVHGDPHYNTFDKVTHNFMGNCTYTLAKVCSNTTSLPYFNVEAKNEHRGNTRVSYVREVLVEVYGERIAIVKKEKSQVLVNNVRQTLPVSAAGGAITVSRSGRYIVLETDFNLRVSYDTDHSVEVKVPTTYFNLTCGMCGNFNNRGEDDYMMPNGQQAADSDALGESWQVPDDDSSCGVPVPPQPCSAEEEKLYRSEQFCGMLTAQPGSFERCHAVINPQSYFETCFYDLCALNGGQEVLCATLEAYADACQAAGVTLLPWRNATFCPIACPPNSHYNPCGSACPDTCVDPLASKNCSRPCVEGCECNNGFVISGGQCVSTSNCGCLLNGKYYEVNGVQVYLPVDLNHGARIAIKGHYVVIDTSLGIQVKFDGDQELFVLVDESLKGQLCGLCGTFNDNQLDDFLKPDKVIEQDPNKFGDSWIVKDDNRTCNPVAVVPPTCDTAKEKEYEELCKIILKNNGPFQVCHWHIPPQLYFESCVYDLCATEGNSDQFCKILEAYAAACELGGVNLGEWRKDTVCEGYYIYLQGSKHEQGEVARLVSPVCSSEGPHCFRFWYHMYGVAEAMALRVYVIHNETSTLEWKDAGNKGDSWNLGEITVHSRGNMQIVLEGMIGEDFRSDIALDDLSIKEGYCTGNTTPTAGTITPTPPKGETTTSPPIPGPGTCVVEGDPHYHTFDKQLHHFMGTCTYTLSKLCDSNSSLPYFNVEVANEHRGSNTRVSYVRYVDIDVAGQRIRLGKGGVVTVNGVAEVLPCTPSAGVQVSSSGFYTVVTTDFGLRVKFDGNHRVEVTLPSTFGQKVCGMCGNYNGMAADDFLNPDGVLEPDSTSLGNSWQVSNDSSCSAGSLPAPACNETDKQVIASSRFCGLLTDTSSPFQMCHAVLSPSSYFDTCLYDLCELGLDHEVLCKSLQSYADACQSLGVKIPVWRNATFCPITCLANSHYEPCAAACPATCVDPMAPATCSLPCVEGCVCDSGYLLYNDRCVPSQQCGCWHNGQHYPVGSEFWTDNTCSSKCTCPARGSKVQCSSASCPAGQYCGVQDGKPECLEQSYGICHVHGDPHYNTFDKVTHNFMGNCTYTLAKVCSNTTSLPYFNVEAKNEHRGNTRVSYVREVLVEVYGERIAIVKKEKSQVLVNNVRQTLPVSAAGGAITVSRSGRYIVLETDFNLRVSYDTDHSVEVKVPTTYFNLTCGMCGNFNNRGEDDYMMPNGQQAADSDALGESWQVPDDDSSCGVPVPPQPCSAEEEKLYRSEQFCGMLTAQPGSFERCHAVINPQSYFETCFYDLCALNGGQEVLCATLEAYADACQAAGVTLLPWRNATFCPLLCPANSYYDPCMTGCPATCVDRQAPQNCSKPCMEGCACTSGFLLSGDTCVPEAQCGCLFEGNYYSEGEHSVNENCTRQCRCEVNGQMVCSALSCGVDEVCEIQNGQRGCYPASTALCHIYGDPHYSTFDGKLHHFQGSCNYTVVTGCDNSSVGFSVTTRNEHRGSKSWTALNSVALSMEGLHIALRKNKAVYINGALTSLPAAPAPGVTVSLSGSYVRVSTKLGLQLQFNGDHELLVRVSEKHKGKLCGLCGAYTGSQQDDFMRPDGVVVPNFNDFGVSWMVPDNDWPCDPAVGPPVSCSPSEEEAANKQCAILTQLGGPFQPCHAVLPPQTYFESCVYDQCATGNSTEHLCNDLGAYAAACAEAGVALGDWSAGTVCGNTTPTAGTITPTPPEGETTTSPPIPGSTPPPECNFACTFDDDFCEWVQADYSSIDWIRHKGPTPTQNTGPASDHTTGDGYYIYLQGSNALPGFAAHLVSPVCSSEGPHCFRFWYHMYGVAEAMALRVYVVKDEELVLVWSSTGNHGDSWNLGEITVHSTGNMQIVLEGEWGEDFRSEVALDDLSIEEGYCTGNATPTAGTITPTPPKGETTTSPPIPGPGTCVVEGDPHYHTFDKQLHHFMGTCTYTLSKLCDSNSSLPYFNVEAANEHRGSNTRVSYVRYVDIDVAGQRIRLGKGGVVTVNGVAEVLPCTPSAGVQVSSSGFYTVVTTDFGLRVKFDGNHRVEVTLPSTFGQKVCGMCGNYNGMAADDFLNPDGVLEPDSTSLGNSWQVSNDSSCSAGPLPAPACNETDKQVIASSRFCGLLTDTSSPFQMCHAVLSPSSYFDTCLYDLCELGLDHEVLCKSLQSYADACQSLGVKIPVWRNATFCPITCPANSHYEPCAAACPATCVDPMAPATCSLPCVEGCVCDSGYLLYNDRCVPSQQCGCWHNGQHYPVGSEFWTDNTCSSKCTCPARGSKVQCSSASCPAGQYCGVQDGKPECLEQSYGICHVHGDPHYNTFDKVTHNFMGNCTYTLAKVCSNTTSLPYFNVEAKNEHRGNTRVSYVREVLVEVYGERIAIVKKEKSQVLVNNVRQTLPVSAAGGAITVSRSGRYIVLETDFNLRVSYDTDHSVEVKVPTTYFNLTCGMCGNFNNRGEDDYMMPNGQQAADSDALGESWQVPDDDSSCGVPVPPQPCSAEEEKLYRSEQFCGMLTAQPGSFERCHAVINPQSYFETCFYDLCALNGGQEVLCATLEAYADACQAAGVTLLPWRNATFCPLLCPANSYYDPCMTGCPATCVDRQAPQNCSKPCMEGCACTSGFLLSGDTCVPEAQCGCLFEGNYYSEGEHSVNENCTRQCRCEANGQMVCSALSCGVDEVCEIQNGQRGCYPASTALCHIYGDPHYSTFDGKLHHFQGSCNYTVVTGCDNSSVGFSVTTRNEHRGSKSWTALNSVALSMEGLHIALRKNKAVYINGALTSLPAAPAPGVTVSLSGSYVRVSTKLGLQLQFNGDHELLVRVSEKHKGKLCGLCGAYTGSQQDDFMRPDGVVVPNFNDFGVSWMVPDNDWPCDPAVGPPVSCSPSEEEAANKQCAILKQLGGPFQPCHAVLPPQTYFESCVYDQCATGNSTEHLCNDLGAYAAACAEAGVALGDWSAGTVCGNTTPTAGTITPTPPKGETTTSPPIPGPGTCVVEGDPHYHTFDKQLHHFMGTCTYTLSKLCDSNSSLPYFNVEAANEHRGSNTRVSYVRYVDIDVAGQRIRLGKGGVVTVNGVAEVLPCTPSAGVQVSSSGFYTVVTTDFGLRVKFDGNHRVEVTLPSTFGQKVCGMCGNYNGMAADDFLNPDRVLEPDSTSLGNSWQVSNDSSCSAGPLPAPACNETDKQVIASSRFCGLLTDTSSPFQMCHAVLSPSSYFDTCLYDLCELGLDHEVLCKSLQSYADACQSLGVKIPVWRNATFCPITCPANSHYEPCAAACPATCVDPMAPATCSLPCVEGCVCDSGYLLYNDRCVPSQQCGCWHNGQHYPVGSEFWTDNTCSSKCTCPARGSKVQCSSASCPAGQYCGVQDGKPECLEQSYGICHVHGDPHYNTFDKVMHNFMGNCTYTLAKVCSNTTSLPYFNVEAKNEHRGNTRVSYVREVLVEVYGERIAIVKKEKSQVLVNNVRQTLPVSAAGGAITVSRSGRYIVLETDFNLRVSYDTDHSVEVKVPTTYFNLTCGMCGNFNNRGEDDYMMPNGQQAADSDALGESWQVPDDDSSCGVPVPPQPCSAEEEKLYRSEQFCGMLTAQPGSFERCHAVINPQSYFETCFYDLCALNGGQEVLCATLEAYADACQAAGVTLLPWRNATFCPLLCPANSYYDPCMTGCPATCVDRQAPQNCSKPCMEGCACTSGFLLSGDTCVPEAQCGCLFEGNYYSEGEHSVNENCTRQCRCEANGQMVCSALSCGVDEVCEIQNGQRGCYPASTALCHIYGDPHYSTFDGKLHHFQGSCNYTVVTGCDNSSVGFSVTTRNEHRGSKSWTALNSVALSMEGLHIALRKNKAVYINGALTSLPAAPAPGVTVSLSGSYVRVSTKLGLQLQFNGDHELLVRVSEKHKGKLCGLCGAYTGSQQDDFMRPDGVVVPNFNDFGVSWMVPDNDWPCDPAVGPPVSCSPSEEEAANKQCAILTQLGGPFQPCHAVLPPQTYFESCVYDQCATGNSTEHLCNDLGAYAAACAEAGVALGDWSAGTVCGNTTPTAGTITPTPPEGETTTSPPIPGSTPPPECNFACTFDDDFCEWVQADYSSIDWIRHKGPTPTQNTGPASDHTTGDGYYIYLQGSNALPGFAAHLVSPVCSSEGPHCFRFWYHMYGVAEAMALRVSINHRTWDHLAKNHNADSTHNKTYTELRFINHRTWDHLAKNHNADSTHNKTYTELRSINHRTWDHLAKNHNADSTHNKTYTELRSINHRTWDHLARHYNTDSTHTITTETHTGLRVHNFMGNCTYTLSKVCNVSERLPYFDVSTTNEHRGTNTKVSYVKSVHVKVYGNQISLLKNKKVNVNGSRMNLPVFIEKKISIQSSGGYLLLETDFGLWVRYDGNHYAEVSAPSDYSGLLCGLCGNYNGDPNDDNIKPNGDVASSSTDLGQSWLVPENNTMVVMCQSSTDNLIVRDVKHMILLAFPSCSSGTEEQCDPVLESEAKKNTACGMITDPTGIFKDCHSKVPPENFFENCVYDMCFTGGQATSLCYGLQAYAEACINAGICTEWRNATLCRQAICQVAGDPHYFTFDGMMYTFVGTCTYTLVEVVEANSVIPITILGKNEDRGLRGATYLKEVYIDVYGVRITLQKKQGILLNNERVYTPVENQLRGVSIGNVGRFIVVETDFGVIVKYDGNHHLEITLPQSYFSKVHGMCGNFNDNREDDLSLRNGTLVSVTQFGNSWKVENDSDEGCLSDLREDDVPPCTAENKPGIESQCNVLKSDKFKACHNLVKPEDFIQSCIYDMCQYDGMKSTLCDIVQVYVDTCRNHGITIKWRNSTFCPLPCPTYSHYTDCVSTCPSTCNDIFASSLCEKTEECTEGCECDDNYVLSNGKCVPLSNCGCRDDDNNYYSAGDTWITPHCAKRCQCQKNGVITCNSYSCDSKETCVIKNGKHKCNPTGFGKCRIMGDPHYITFDGLVHHFQGKYTYIVAQTIPDLPDTLTQFSIEGTNYPFHGNRHITYLKEILVNVYGHTVQFKQNKQLVLDGVRVRPPAHPHEGIRIYQRTSRIYLETDFGLYLSFDGSQNADIKLANTYINRVEGLCGNFDGRYRNDFTNPNGVWVKNVNVFGESWKVPLKRTSRVRRDVNSKDESEEEPDPGLFQGCNENQLEDKTKTSRCQILTESNGPFAKCHSTVSPDFYFTSCLFDMCVEGDNDTTLCRSLEEYVLACQQQGVSMDGWRQQTVCGGPCMPNPCKNDGVCSETTNGTSLYFYCECSELYTGPSCEAEKIVEEPPTEDPENHTIAIVIGVVAGVVVVIILISSTVYLYRRKRKTDTAVISRESSLKWSRNASNDRIHEQDYGYIVNTAFEQN